MRLDLYPSSSNRAPWPLGAFGRDWAGGLFYVFYTTKREAGACSRNPTFFIVLKTETCPLL